MWSPCNYRDMKMTPELIHQKYCHEFSRLYKKMSAQHIEWTRGWLWECTRKPGNHLASLAYSGSHEGTFGFPWVKKRNAAFLEKRVFQRTLQRNKAYVLIWYFPYFPDDIHSLQYLHNQRPGTSVSNGVPTCISVAHALRRKEHGLQ